MESTESKDQEAWVKRLQDKLEELKEQRVKVDLANEVLRKKIQTLSTHMDTLNQKYSNEDEDKSDDTQQSDEQKNTTNGLESNGEENQNKKKE